MKEKLSKQNKDINKPEGAEKNGDFWEKSYDDVNVLFCPECGTQIFKTRETIEAEEQKCASCGFEGKTT